MIPNTPELTLIVVRPDVEVDGMRSRVGAVVTWPREKAITALRTGAFDLASRYPQAIAEGVQ